MALDTWDLTDITIDATEAKAAADAIYRRYESKLKNVAVLDLKEVAEDFIRNANGHGTFIQG